MFPAISPSQRLPYVQFTLRMESIEDLFYDGKDPEAEILRVQSVVDANNGQRYEQKGVSENGDQNGGCRSNGGSR